jgi:hypothetical protein
MASLVIHSGDFPATPQAGYEVEERARSKYKRLFAKIRGDGYLAQYGRTRRVHGCDDRGTRGRDPCHAGGHHTSNSAVLSHRTAYPVMRLGRIWQNAGSWTKSLANEPAQIPRCVLYSSN